MILCEVINPSDPYTLIVQDGKEGLAAAALAIGVLGSGAYALNDEAGKTVVPITILGYEKIWYSEQFGMTVEELFDQTPMEMVAACLESVTIGTFESRKEYLLALEAITDPDKRTEYIAKWHDLHRSSLNDIGGRAVYLAKAIRDGIAHKAKGSEKKE